MAGVRGDLPRIRLLPAPREGPKDPDRDVGPSFVRCSVVAIPSSLRRRFDPDAAGGGKVRLSSRRTPNESIEATGAGDGTRTRYLNLGKVALCQVSYSRTGSLRV